MATLSVSRKWELKFTGLLPVGDNIDYVADYFCTDCAHVRSEQLSSSAGTTTSYAEMQRVAQHLTRKARPQPTWHSTNSLWEGELFSDRLKEQQILAQQCRFGILEDRMLHSRYIFAISHKVLQQWPVQENPSCDEVVEMWDKEHCSKIPGRVDAVKRSTCFRLINARAELVWATSATTNVQLTTVVKSRSPDFVAWIQLRLLNAVAR